MSDARAERLPSYAVFAALLASAGLPIYIHAPKFFVDEYGVSLAAVGFVLFGLRLFDFVQDPLLGWLSEALRRWRAFAVATSVLIMAVSMVGLFAIEPPVHPLAWFALTLTGLFTSFSFLTINFYAQGVVKARDLGAGGHVRLATWRETGALLGICAAAVAPTVLVMLSASPFAVFGAGFAVFAGVAAWAMRQEWRTTSTAPPAGIRPILRDKISRRLLLIALLNATPVAVTSTLFLFFVESRLDAPGFEGPLLLVFFLAAAGSAPVWGWIAKRIGPKKALLAGMVLAIVSFGFAAMLGAGDWPLFAVICLASGAALGADMTLLPAIFADRMATVAPDAGQAFGLWSFVSKFTLAFAAVILLPLLEAAGFEAGASNPEEALVMLTILYALLPCALKLFAIGLLAVTSLKES
ncbi:MAG: MFS transporter [Alphaproteobacteria bacterium]|nr:MFS transporter [Alphaproteobacteria bacterium]NNF24357.1 sugar:cation symporter [Paracoccaceae bacterium]